MASIAFKRPRAAFEADLVAQQSPYVFYGSPLPANDPSVRDDSSYVPLWKQEVRDDRGRKRLHGAFTGGFSAGYYNTVGSKEGWIPSAFVSSRELRQKDKQAASSQRPEDFMDEEDLQDAADKENLQTRESFAGLGEESSISAKSLSVDLLSMSSEKIGARLLQRMGWREGQGIGPKILRKARLRDDADDIDDHDDVHYFAPKDTKLISFNRKDNSKGLGFTEGDASLQKMATLSSDVPLKDNELDMFNLPVRKREGKAAKKRGGIGIGILNDTGSDEEDPYEIGPRISYSRTTVPTSNKNKSKQTKSQVSSANPLLTTKPFFQSKKNTVVSKSSSRRRCHDGLPPLPGFYLAELLEVQSLASKYPFPQVPPHWTTSRTSSTDKKFPTHVPKMSSLSAKSGMNPSARAATLGEAMLPGKSVFDFVSSVNRNRIADATNNVNLPSGLGQKISDSGNIHEKWKGENVKTDIPYLEKDVALGALHRSMLRGMPYADDAEKLKRYRSFLRYSAGLLKDLQSSQPELPHDQKVIEYQEFTQTARVFQPISSTMATRFTSSSTEPNTSTVKNEGVSDKASVDFPDVKSSAEAAAKAGMYGQLTRSVHAFHPTPLVCKRFGVPQPLPSQDDDNVQGSTDKSNLAGDWKDKLPDLSSAPGKPANKRSMGEDATKAEVHAGHDRHVSQANASEGRLDLERNDALEAQRAGDELFRSIFGTDDS